ncbi:MAG: phosphomannomutase/phosphoglucomutase [Clostridiales bacterium]|nr:phosphomannomutase/phosphoglucomutase [Clostridiales bacterium]
MGNYEILKSGTDIRGRAIENNGKLAILTDKAVGDLAAAFVCWLSESLGRTNLKIAMGRDSRITGEHFSRVIVKTLRFSQLDFFDCGLISTPSAFMLTQFPSMKVDGAIMITASHHPYDINGLKFFTAEGGVNSAQLDEIIELADRGVRPNTNIHSTVLRKDGLRLYCDMLCETIRKGTGLFKPLKDMKIVVDAGHGAGGFFANRVLTPLGADVSGSQFLEPDGNFPAHKPNPEDPEAMESLKNRVLETGADLGIIFDADVDRCGLVAADGTEINRCALIALASALVLPEHPGATIVTDSVTTEGLRQFIENKGGRQKRFRRGYRNVIDEAKRLIEEGVDAPLAIESSGHAAFADNYFLDDGAYFIAKVLVALSKLRAEGLTLTDLIADLHTPLEEADIRLSLVGIDWRDTVGKILSRLKVVSERLLKIPDESYEGVRAYVAHAKGYFIVRASVHDPVIPIYIESDKVGGALSVARFLYSFMRGFRGVDVTPLKDFIAKAEKEYNERVERGEIEQDEYEEAYDETIEQAEDGYSENGEFVEEDFGAEGEYEESYDETIEQTEDAYAENGGSEEFGENIAEPLPDDFQ